MANSIDWGIASFDSEWGQGTSLTGGGSSYADKLIIIDFKNRVERDSGTVESLTCIEI